MIAQQSASGFVKRLSLVPFPEFAGCMKLVTYGQKSVLVGTEAAGLLIEFAALLGARGGSDVVTLRAIDTDGNDVDASFLINAATELAVQTASTTASEPDNSLVAEYLHERIDELNKPFWAEANNDV